MKLRTPSLPGIAMWMLFFALFSLALFVVQLEVRHGLLRGVVCFFCVVVAVGATGWLAQTLVGFIDTEWVTGLILGSALMLALVFLISKPSHSNAGLPHSLSLEQACTALRTAIAQAQHAPHGIAEYRCEDGDARQLPGFYVFSLRSNYPAPPHAGLHWVGSSLVGWYAVRGSDGQLYNWNIAEEKLDDAIR